MISHDPRRTGVRTAVENGPKTHSGARQLLGAVPLQLSAICYLDENGRERRRMVAHDGGSVVYFIGTEQEARSLSIASEWLTSQFFDKVGTLEPGGTPEPLPTEDKVDVSDGVG